jgi:hypothetical protein
MKLKCLCVFLVGLALGLTVSSAMAKNHPEKKHHPNRHEKKSQQHHKQSSETHLHKVKLAKPQHHQAKQTNKHHCQNNCNSRKDLGNQPHSQVINLPTPKLPSVAIPLPLAANPIDTLINQSAKEAKERVREMTVRQE